MQTRNTVCLCMMLVAGITLGGCATSINDPQGRREAVYEWGTLRATFPTPIEHTFKAAQETFKELDLKVLGANQDGIAAELLSRDAQGKEVSVAMEATPDGGTRVRIRVGKFGDQNKSVVLLRHIKRKL